MLAVDKDNKLYEAYLQHPAFTNDEINEFVKKENVVRMLDETVAFSKKQPGFYSHYIRLHYS